MVFMGHGGTKERHDAVPHDLVDRPLVAVHGRHHVCQDGVEELPSLLRIAFGQQFHGALQVRKQHGDLLAFAFQGGTRCQNFLGQVRRWGHRWGGRWGRRCATGPDQHGAVLIDGQALALNNFGCEVRQVRLIKIELALQGPVGQAAAALEQR